MSTDTALLIAHLWLIASYFAESKLNRLLMALTGIVVAITTFMWGGT